MSLFLLNLVDQFSHFISSIYLVYLILYTTIYFNYIIIKDDFIFQHD